MDFYFLPALTAPSSVWAPGGRLSAQYAGTEIRRPKAPEIGNWMDEGLRGTPTYYPHALVSYYIWRDNPIQFNSEAVVFGDSGGFSVIRHGTARAEGAPHQRRLDPTDIVRWQSEVCTLGVLLDVPPEDYLKEHIWAQAKAKTVSYTKSGLRMYKQLRTEGTAFRWWGVVHGWNLEQRDVWWQEISDVYPFTEPGEGWAIRLRPRAGDPRGIALGLYWLDQREITRAHFLMAAHPTAMAVMLALGPATRLQFISCDSTSAARVAINRYIWVLNDGSKDPGLINRPADKEAYGWHAIEERGDERNVRQHLLEECGCFSCIQIQKDAEDWTDLVHATEFNSYWRHRFAFHNYILQFNEIKRLEAAAASNPEGLLRSVLGNSYGAVLKAFDGQEDLGDRGFPRGLLKGL